MGYSYSLVGSLKIGINRQPPFFILHFRFIFFYTGRYANMDTRFEKIRILDLPEFLSGYSKEVLQEYMLGGQE